MTRVFYLPTSFEQDLKSKISGEWNHIDWSKPMHFDKLLYVVSLLGSEVGGYREDKNGWIPLKKTYLDDVVQSRYSTNAINYLIHLGILEREESYWNEGLFSCVRGRSKRYRLCEPYRSAPPRNHHQVIKGSREVTQS